MKHFIRNIAEHRKLFRDDKTGIAWIEDGSTGLSHSAHPNIDSSGSVSGMKNLGYWGENDKVVFSHGYYYNISRIAGSDALDRLALVECQCEKCRNKDFAMKFRISEERYSEIKQNYNDKISDSEIAEIINEWGPESINNGYTISNFDGTGMLEVCRIDDIMAFKSEEEAVNAAQKDGIKFIPVNELPENFERRYLGWIDTPENRKKIQEHASQNIAKLILYETQDFNEEVYYSNRKEFLKDLCEEINCRGVTGVHSEVLADDLDLEKASRLIFMGEFEDVPKEDMEWLEKYLEDLK